jgi:hypothetical protein
VSLKRAAVHLEADQFMQNWSRRYQHKVQHKSERWEVKDCHV